jgi:hypothetical protein
MADEWDQFPDAQQADPFADFPDAQPAQPAQPPGQRFATNVRAIAQPQAEKPQSWWQATKNVGQGAAEFATGITGQIAGRAAGLGALAYDVTANAVLHPFSGSKPGHYADPEAVQNRVIEATTYRAPDPNNLTRKILNYPGEQVIAPVSQSIGSALEKTGIPYVDHFGRALPEAVLAGMGIRAGMPVKSKQGVQLPARIDTRPPQATPEQLAIRNATDSGYKLSPSQVDNKGGAFVEGASGQAALDRTISLKNAKATDELAKKALGITDEKLTDTARRTVRVQANKAYDEVAKTGPRKTSDAYRKEIEAIDDRTGSGSFAEDVPEAVVNLKKYYKSRPGFDAKDAVAKVRQLRKDSRLNQKNQDPEKQALGHMQQKIAEALDNELERHVADIGKPDLVADYKAARVKLAKLGTVEDALSGTNVSAKKIHQQWKRGAPLEGELLAIARAYDNFPSVLQEAAKIRGKHPFSVVDYLVAAGSVGGATLNPALLAGVAARPIARAALASDTYQRNFVAPRGKAAAPKQAPVKPKPAAAAAPLIPADQRRAR